MNEELKDSCIESTQASGNDVQPIQSGGTPIPPPEKANEGNDVKEPPASPRGPSSAAGESAVSAQKVEANRKNAQKSTGPRTDAGKAKSAMNSYKHGFFAKRLFPTAEQLAKDESDYLAVADGIYEHYQPSGFMENFWAEKIATEAVRLARLMGYEPKEKMDWPNLFWKYSDSILRYETATNRRLTEAIEELERLQTKRKAETASEKPLRSEAGDAAAEPEAAN